MNAFNPMQSSLARLVNAGNAAISKSLLSEGRTVVEELLLHHGDGVEHANATLRTTHDRYGDDYPGVEEIDDHERYSETDVDFSQITMTAAEDKYLVSANNAVTRESIANGLRDYGLKVRTEDLVDAEYEYGDNIVQFHPNCLLYVGSVSVNVGAQ